MINQLYDNLVAILASDPLTAGMVTSREDHPQGIPKSPYITLTPKGSRTFYLLGRYNTMDRYKFHVEFRGVGNETTASEMHDIVRQVLVGSTMPALTNAEFIQIYMSTDESAQETISHTFGNNKIIDRLVSVYYVEVQRTAADLEYGSSSEMP